MESVLYVGQSVNNEALATRVSLVLEASDTMFNDYFGEGLVVVAEEYLKLESTPTIVIDEGVLVVTWYSREKEIEVEWFKLISQNNLTRLLWEQLVLVYSSEFS